MSIADERESAGPEFEPRVGIQAQIPPPPP
jgi:hypothetical protein